MEKKEVGIGTPITVAGVTVIPIVEVSLNYWHNTHAISFFGVKQPISIVVISPSSRRAFRITGEEVSLDQLTKEVPGVEEILAGL